MKEFALHAGKWIVWNRTGWSEFGWMRLAVTPIFKPGWTPRFYLVWNGERFSDDAEHRRASEKAPAEVEELREALRRMLPRRSEAA